MCKMNAFFAGEKYSTLTKHKHLQATERIIQYAGPQCFSCEHRIRYLFSSLHDIVRILVFHTILWLTEHKVYPALRDRTPTFLASSDWLAVLGSITNYRCTETTIWPIVVKIPELMHYFDLLDTSMQSPVKTTRALYSLLDKVRGVSSSLDTWLETFESSLPVCSRLSWSSISPLDTCFSPPTWFANIECASVITLYWAYQLQLSTLEDAVYTRLNLHIIVGSTDEVRHVSRSHYFMSMIGRSGHYWLNTQPIPHDDLTYSFTFARTIAWHWCADNACGEEMLAFADMRDRMLTSIFGWAAELIIDGIYKPPPGTEIGKSALAGIDNVS